MVDVSLRGKTAVVTGGSSGIGAAIVARLLAEGSNVVSVDLQPPRAGFDGRATTVIADVSTEAGVAAYMAAAMKRYGRLDCFVNNAGILGPSASFADARMADVDKVFAVNMRSTFLGMQAALKQFQLQGTGGGIVNLASMSASRPNPMRPAYAASKAAVIALTKAAAIGYGPSGVRINAISPGIVETPMNAEVESTRGAAGSRVTDSWPIPRKARPGEIAALVCWLLSDESSFVTGAHYPIDGGATA
ncbi:MAG TPA: SDR family oxidoreductase [Dongiaceae bacterium]|nr:SDR family oxidoreductase [Dongiaceae bacterium]